MAMLLLRTRPIASLPTYALLPYVQTKTVTSPGTAVSGLVLRPEAVIDQRPLSGGTLSVSRGV